MLWPDIRRFRIALGWTGPRDVADGIRPSFAGSCPIPASSGQTERHRLSRHGDRQLNKTLYTIALTRIRIHPETQRYAARRLAEGKTNKDIRRCLKRAIARQIYRHLETHANLNPGLDTT